MPLSTEVFLVVRWKHTGLLWVWSMQTPLVIWSLWFLLFLVTCHNFFPIPKQTSNCQTMLTITRMIPKISVSDRGSVVCRTTESARLAGSISPRDPSGCTPKPSILWGLPKPGISPCFSEAVSKEGSDRQTACHGIKGNWQVFKNRGYITSILEKSAANANKTLGLHALNGLL